MIMRHALGVLLAVLIVLPAIASDTGRKDSYVLRDGDITYMLGEGMSAAALKQIQERFGREFFWARRSGRTLISRDANVIDQARSVLQTNVGDRSEQERRIAIIADRAFERRASYILAIGDGVAFSSRTTPETVKTIRKQHRGRFLWFRRDGRAWLIDDPDWVDRATAFFSGQMALAQQQVAVSREEAKLDREEKQLEEKRDAASRARLDEVRRKQADVSRRSAALDQREEELESEAEAKLWLLTEDAVRRGVARRLR